MGGMVEVGEGAYTSLEDKHMDIDDLWHMEGDAIARSSAARRFRMASFSAPRTRKHIIAQWSH